MKDREFINMVIDNYLSYAIDPHMATLNNTVVNRLHDIADKLEDQEKFIDIIKRKGMFISAKELSVMNTYEDYKSVINERKLQQELMMHITPTLIDWDTLESTPFYTEKEFDIVRTIIINDIKYKKDKGK